MAFPLPPAPVARTTEGVVYDLDALITWASGGAKAYADAHSQGLACIGFYNNLKDTK